jgi:hypothetical protein
MPKNQSFDDRRHSTSIAKLSEVLQPQKALPVPCSGAVLLRCGFGDFLNLLLSVEPRASAAVATVIERARSTSRHLRT